MSHIALMIPSYLPNDPDRRAARIMSHMKQINWVNTHFGWLDIVLCLQNWTDEEVTRVYGLRTNAVFIRLSEPCGLCKARNYLFDWLWQHPHYEWGIFTDDDVIPADLPGTLKFIEELDTYPDKFDFADIIVPRLITGTLANKKTREFLAYQAKQEVQGFTFKHTWRQGMHWMVLKNIVKHGQEPYFHPIIDTAHGEGYEDMILCTDWMLKGRKIYRCNEFVVTLENTAADVSTIFDSGELRNQFHEQSILSMNKRYEGTAVQFYTTGRYDTMMKPEVKEECKRLYLPDLVPEVRIPIGYQGLARRRRLI